MVSIWSRERVSCDLIITVGPQIYDRHAAVFLPTAHGGGAQIRDGSPPEFRVLARECTNAKCASDYGMQRQWWTRHKGPYQRSRREALWPWLSPNRGGNEAPTAKSGHHCGRFLLRWPRNLHSTPRKAPRHHLSAWPLDEDDPDTRGRYLPHPTLSAHARCLAGAPMTWYGEGEALGEVAR
jgi:hypothetical protein